MSLSAHTSPPARWRWLLPAAVLVLLFHLSPVGPNLDHALFDLASRHPLQTPALPEASAFVMIDDDTLAALSKLGVRWPFQRRYFAQLIVALHQAGAKRVVMDYTFFEQSGFNEQDRLLVSAATAATSVVLARTRERRPFDGFDDNLALVFPRSRAGEVEFPVDDDGVVRRFAVPGSLAALAVTVPPDRAGGLLRWHGGLAQLRSRGVPVLSAGNFIIAGRTILEKVVTEDPDPSAAGFAAVLRKEPPLGGPLGEAVKGRVVFVGANAHGTFDLKTLPIGKLEPGVLVHWTAWANLTGGGFVAALPRWGALGGAVLAAALVLVAGRRRAGLVAPVATGGALALLVPVVAYAGISAGWYLPPLSIVAAVLLTLLGVTAETFWLEQARKREIQSMFGAYVDPEVVAQLVRDPASIRLGGERREATVFFSDLAGFTDLSEKLRDQPEKMVEVVNAYLEETSDCLLNHGAYVDKYIGDAVMAVFGAPQPLPNHALAACEAALGAQRLIAGINARYAASAGVTLAVRIGLNTGEMIVGNLGSSRKKNYTVMGDAVNLASRLEGANKHFGTGILLGPETAARVQGVLATRPLARLRVKGKAQAVEVHTLHGRPAELAPAEAEFLRLYGAGYAALSAHRFAAAAEALAQACALWPDDLTARHWRDEATRLQRVPPPADWEPLLALDSK